MVRHLTIYLVAFAMGAACLMAIDSGMGVWEWLLRTFGIVSLAAFIGISVAKKFAQPIGLLRKGAARIEQGEFGHQIDGGDWWEYTNLAGDFNRMSRRLAEQFRQLGDDRNQLRTVLAGLVEGVIAVDANQNLLFANDSAARMLNFSAEALVARPIWEATRLPQIQKLLAQALKTQEPCRLEIDYNVGPARNLALYVAPLALETQGAILVVQDTTELRRLERLRQEFVANVSHELKTPLAIIQSHIEALLDGAAEDAEVRRTFLDQIADQSARLYSLILDLLRLAAIESQEEALMLQPIDLGRAIDECRERHIRRADAKGMTIELQPPGQFIEVSADDDALAQILDNLVDNAVKYTPNGGKVMLGWSTTDHQVVIAVADNGAGIPERDTARLFERFYRVDRARSRELGGTGLGLAIVKHLAQAMKGSARVESTVGRGTTFTILLPRAGTINGMS